MVILRARGPIRWPEHRRVLGLGLLVRGGLESGWRSRFGDNFQLVRAVEDDLRPAIVERDLAGDYNGVAFQFFQVAEQIGAICVDHAAAGIVRIRFLKVQENDGFPEGNLGDFPEDGLSLADELIRLHRRPIGWGEVRTDRLAITRRPYQNYKGQSRENLILRQKVRPASADC